MSRETTTGSTTATKKRARLVTANVFERAQIKEFEAVFNLIDRNRDGLIDKDELRGMLISLGKDPTDDCLEDMMDNAPGPINFTMFLALFGEMHQSTDDENVIKDAFGRFDENNEGVINEALLRELLVTTGDKFTNEDVDELFREAPISNGMFNYIDFVRRLKFGAEEKNEI